MQLSGTEAGEIIGDCPYFPDDLLILADDSNAQHTSTLTYKANNEIDQLTDDRDPTTTYTFDAWGRTSTEAKNGVTKTYSWVSANLLGGINSSASGDTDVTYAYTGDLKRVWRLENGTLTNAYQWDAGFNVVNELNNVNPMKTFVPGLAEVGGNAPATTATYNYLTTDRFGSTRGLWDGSLAQTGSWEFTPYGSPYNFAGPTDVTQLYTGLDVDKVTGGYYAPFRYVNPSFGRWANQEPLGMAFGTNMYSYVGGNPLRYIDPSGLGWIGTRPLDAEPFPYGLGPIGKICHQAVFYGRPDGDRNRNIGYYSDGFHRDDPYYLNMYVPTVTNLDDQILRVAVARVQGNGRLKLTRTLHFVPRYEPDGGSYSLFGRNCQMFVSEVLAVYEDIGPTLEALLNSPFME